MVLENLFLMEVAVKKIIISLILIGSSIIAREKSVGSKDGGYTLIEHGSTGSVGEVIELTEDTFYGQITGATKPVVISFNAAWSGACNYCKPFFAELAHEEDWVFAEVDVDKVPSLTATFNVQSFPTFMVFKGGVQWGMFRGARAKQSLRSEFKRIIDSEFPEVIQEAYGVQLLITAIAQQNVADIRKLIEG